MSEKEWGEKMTNCIASYKNSSSTLLGIYRNNELIYNLEIKEGVIRQFRAKHNQNPKIEDKKKFEQFFNRFNKKLMEDKNGTNSDNLVSCNSSY